MQSDPLPFHIAIYDRTNTSSSLIKTALESFSCRLEVVKDVQKLVTTDAPPDYDLFILTWDDNDPSPTSLIPSLHCKYPEMQFIVTKKNGSKVHAANCLRDGVLDFICRPWNDEVFRNRVSRAISKTKLLKRLSHLYDYIPSAIQHVNSDALQSQKQNGKRLKEIRKQALSDFSDNHILLLDSDRNSAKSKQKLLSSFGSRCDIATTLDQAREIIQTKCIDLLIADKLKPVREFNKVLKWMRQNWPISSILLVSGSVNQIEFDNIMEIGIDGFIIKPYSNDDFHSQITQTLQRQNMFKRYYRSATELMFFTTGGAQEQFIKLKPTEQFSAVQSFLDFAQTKYHVQLR